MPETLRRALRMKTVLIIDDDEPFRSTIAALLRSHEWTVFEAEDGEQGIGQALRHRPAVVLVDLRLPRTNGFQVCRALRAQPELLPRTRLIVTTGSSFASDRQNAFEAGADECLVKPVQPATLLASLARLLNDQAAGSPPAETRGAGFDGTSTRIRFWGVRGSIPTPGPHTVRYGGNTACVEVRAEGQIIVLDAGTGIRALGQALHAEFAERPLEVTILITHTHWDHIHGFPFFLPAYHPLNRVRILGYEGARKGLEGTLSGQMESPYFPIRLRELPGHLRIEELRDLQFSIGSVRVQAVHVHHPDLCMGYRLFTAGGSIAYLPDFEPYAHALLMPVGGDAAERQARAEFARREHAKLVEFLRGADVLIADAQYDAEEYPRHAGWGHSCVDDTVALAASAQVKQLFLFHHDPDHDDARVDQLLARARELAASLDTSLAVEAAREGLEWVLTGAGRRA
jgi:phosphoribosyl 1,2-cyclic phosphodiesterase/CheY-like chemotaxis protein